MPPLRDRLARSLARRRNRVLLGLLVLGVLVRLALPWVLRPVIVSQADAALVGRIVLADLGLSLLRGGVTLRGLELRTDELPPPAAEGAPPPAPAPPPLFEAKRLWVQISWLALLSQTLEVEELEIEGFVARLDRLEDGLLLPKGVPREEPPEPEPEEPLGWSFALDAVAFRDGEIHFQDFTVGEAPQRFDLAVEDLSASDLALVIDPTGLQPGHVVVNARVGEGAVGLDAQVEARREGPAVTAKIKLTRLPIDGVRAYLRMFGWSDLRGTLDAALEHRFETGGAHRVSGVVSLSDVAVQVPALDPPALAWRKLTVAIEALDLVGRSLAVSEVALEGPRIPIDARATAPVPLLARPAGAGEPEAEPEAAAPGEADGPDWTWRVGRVRLTDATVDLLGEEGPLALGIAAELGALASLPAGRSPVSLSVKQGDGSLAVDGELSVSPLGFDGKLGIAALELPPLLVRLPVPGAALLRQGTLRADLEVALAPKDGGSGAAPTDLRVAGTVGLAKLDLGEAVRTRDFGVEWKDLEVGIQQIALPGALGARDPAQPRALDVELARIHLVEPALRITRAEQGLVLPALGGEPAAPESANGDAAPDAPPAAPADAADATVARPAPEIRVRVADARIERGRARIVDRGVKPHYRSQLDRVDLRARGVRWPGPVIDDLVLAAQGLEGASLDVRGSIGTGSPNLDAKLVKLPLAPFNPYVTPRGYSLAGGTLSFDSRAKLGRDAYDTSTRLVISQLEVGGEEGESLFQKNFGIPLTVALGLLKDLRGDVTLSVPVAGDRTGTRTRLRTLVAQALRKALMGALASPLKLLGAVVGDGKVEAMAPEPIAFLPGRAEPAEAGEDRIEQLAGLLSASPGLALTLRGSTGEDDERWLEEQALLEELRATSGLRALGKLGQIGTRRAVREYLEARHAGQEATLEPEAAAWLEAEIERRTLDPAQLEALAEARAEAAQRKLSSEHGIAAARLALGPPAGEPAGAQPAVTIALGRP
jgi:hypothetical protein